MIYLASQSRIRHQLLQDALIPFKIIGHNANERSISWNGSIEDITRVICEMKMDSLIIDSNQYPSEIILLTADTLTADKNGTIYGKPADVPEAIAMVKKLRQGSSVTTAFCLEKRLYKNNSWQIISRHTEAVTAQCAFILEDNEIMNYFEKQPSALQAAGALTIEGYGNQFLKSVKGSYSTILGLPMYELRKALMGFNAL